MSGTWALQRENWAGLPWSLPDSLDEAKLLSSRWQNFLVSLTISWQPFLSLPWGFMESRHYASRHCPCKSSGRNVNAAVREIREQWPPNLRQKWLFFQCLSSEPPERYGWRFALDSECRCRESRREGLQHRHNPRCDLHWECMQRLHQQDSRQGTCVKMHHKFALPATPENLTDTKGRGCLSLSHKSLCSFPIYLVSNYIVNMINSWLSPS